MTREETGKILAVIASIYPNFKPENKSQTVDAWCWALDGYTYKDISTALKAYITTSAGAFPPSASQLIALTRKSEEITALTEAQAWAMVKKAISNGNYGSEEEFAKLPPTVQKAVGGASMIREWAGTDSSEVNTVIMSNFQRAFRTIQQREQEMNALPAELKTMLGLNEKIGIEGRE